MAWRRIKLVAPRMKKYRRRRSKENGGIEMKKHQSIGLK
jgi:hypothetical protein